MNPNDFVRAGFVARRGWSEVILFEDEEFGEVVHDVERDGSDGPVTLTLAAGGSGPRIPAQDVAVFEVIREVAEGRFRGGERELGLADDGVGYVSDANNRDLLPPDVVARLEELRAEIVAGRIQVPFE